MDQIKKRALTIILFVLLILMAFVLSTLNNKLHVMQSSVDTLEKALQQKEAKLQEQNRTLQTVLAEKTKAEAYIETLSKELEGSMMPLQAPNKSNTNSNENNRSRGIRG